MTSTQLPSLPVRRASLVALAAVVLAGAGVACSSKAAPGDAGADGGTPIFAANFRQAGFQMVRTCRGPGEHSGLAGFTVWVSDATAAGTYNQLLSGGAAGTDGAAAQMPDGAVVVKELYTDRDCTTVDRWVAMKKVAGFDPTHGDWFWQDLSPTRAVRSEGQQPLCSDCHEGRPDGTCIGYGAVNGMDYLCTAP